MKMIPIASDADVPDLPGGETRACHFGLGGGPSERIGPSDRYSNITSTWTGSLHHSTPVYTEV